MSAWYRFSTDPVTRDQEITLRERETLAAEPEIKYNLVANYYAGLGAPETVMLHLTSRSSRWHFRDVDTLLIRADERLFELADPAPGREVLDNGDAFEQFTVRLTLEQFRASAWATNVWVKLGYKNCEIPRANRQKWKVLWNYVRGSERGENHPPSSHSKTTHSITATK